MASRPEDIEITQKRGDIGSGTYREPVFFLKHVHCFQKRWYQITNHRSKAAKSIYRKSSIQDGGFDSNTVSPPEGGGGFLCKIDLQDALPFRTGFLTKNFLLNA